MMWHMCCYSWWSLVCRCQGFTSTPLTTNTPQHNQLKIGETHITKENREEKTTNL
jgi:hypothetical protein